MATFLTNKFVRSNYEILETLEAGLVLHGFEVKSLREKHGSLKEAYVTIDNNEAYLVGAHIPAYQPNNTPADFDPYRRRKLLLSKSQIKDLLQRTSTQGLTVVPISLYNKERSLKLEIGVGRGKKKHDKREDLKKRDDQRDIDRAMKGL